MVRTVLVVSIVAALIGASVQDGAAQTLRSAEAAATLTKLLAERRLEAVAARDPNDPTRFISALYMPGSQLLVVSARYPVPPALEQRIAEGKFRDAYLDIQGAGTRDGRFFVMDLQADGLRSDPDPNQPFDIIYKNGIDQVTYDGDWKAQKLTQAKYVERFAADDREYARMLVALSEALSKAGASAVAVKQQP
jgi:hypothetical protein